ncbi:MAG: biotin transporter BioY [Spirochaetales bacterium]|nr:biotin transporter BioY [Spirochaetales bacterium]MBO7349597.1 biotin transporter BioY [Spirochaetales bacterium]
MKKENLSKSIVFVALFAAISAISGFLAVPVPGTPVPIVLQNMMVVLSGMLLGPVLGTLSTLLFVVAGILGLPILSGGTGGFAKLMSPTGGFIVGYVISSLVAGLILGRPVYGKKVSIVKTIVAAFTGFVVMYIPGILHFMNIMDADLKESLMLCILPYLPGDLLKLILCVLLSVALRSSVASFVFGDDAEDD